MEIRPKWNGLDSTRLSLLAIEVSTVLRNLEPGRLHWRTRRLEQRWLLIVGSDRSRLQSAGRRLAMGSTAPLQPGLPRPQFHQRAPGFLLRGR
jgi:hypothetical protein